MTCTSYYKNDDEWKEICDIHVKHEETWKKVCAGWRKTEGEWQHFYVSNTPSVEFLVVAGGGGGGANNVGYDPSGGGGGAGGFRASAGVAQTSGRNSEPESALSLEVGVTYTVEVGGGGDGSNGDYSHGETGNNSVLGPITSLGGGGAGYYGSTSYSGGSGGGRPGGGGRGCGTVNQGHDGDTAASSQGRGGGGAGGSSLGCTGGTDSGSSDGGDGLPSDITGISTYYAGGGGTYGGDGGIGGGGDGGYNNYCGSSKAWSHGTTNTGGGGGGTGNICAGGRPGNSQLGNGLRQAGNGGSGIVIFRVAQFYQARFSAGMTVNGQSSVSSFVPTPNTAVSGYNIYNVTGGIGSFTLEFA